MLEFISTIAVIALVFCAATVFVALIAGSLMKVRDAMMKRAEEKAQ
jgi:hypothetical protein